MKRKKGRKEGEGVASHNRFRAVIRLDRNFLCTCQQTGRRGERRGKGDSWSEWSELHCTPCTMSSLCRITFEYPRKKGKGKKRGVCRSSLMIGVSQAGQSRAALGCKRGKGERGQNSFLVVCSAGRTTLANSAFTLGV